MRQKVRANPAVCWFCDRRLSAGGWFYALASINGTERPVHSACRDLAVNDLMPGFVRRPGMLFEWTT